MANFQLAQHTFTKEKFYVHREDVASIGGESDTKVLVYSAKFSQYFGPCEKYPTGHYTAKTRVFIGKFLEHAGP